METNEENFLSILSERKLESLLSPAEALTIQGKLWDVLAKRAESYTMGGSSSVRAETARELLNSAGFVLRHGLGDIGPEAVKAHLLNDDYDALFKSGLRAVEAQVAEGKTLLETALRTATAVENGAYRETLRALGDFFRRYHYHHFAHDIPCMLDYPLAQPVDEALLGIDYINEYLRRLGIENDFCARFDAETVTRLLRSVSPDFEENLLSIYEAVSSNALALTLLGGDVFSLDITDKDRTGLLALFGAWTADTAPPRLAAAVSELCVILSIDGAPAKAYLAETAAALYDRVGPMLPLRRLEHLFPPLYREKDEKKPAVTYIDGALMDDEKLRALIDELTACRHASDKIALARRNICSLRDWAEVLDICFWGDELEALFGTFSGEELRQLRFFAAHRRQKYPGRRSETGWEVRLDGYK
ncbi:hypothetical protein SAMN02745823_00997 [Sporobacter termitidis DSM 10068]|uniref:Uncharacterized protein n=1 Tax=Sporobacter termitidis DSM 10068 TaxID=1123282 RepID=A0A1M5VS82_9FIRM|nr:DUF6179 domain-containing protein [Sporobacter termitidis]SHH78131.1 hypothetical protein SAMN02745823_00997 [Sporobacter termitidis DSM 10068]